MNLSIFNSKNSLIRLFLFGLGLVLILYLLEGLVMTGVRKSHDSQTGKINKIFAHEVDPEIVVFGSSVAEVGFNSALIHRNTGLSVYNTAIDGTRLKQNKALIDEFLSYSKNCKYVFIGLAFFSFTEENSLTEPSRFYAHLSNDNFYGAFKEMQPQLAFKMKYVPFYSFTQLDHTFYKNSLIGWKNYLMGTEKKDTLFGYIPHFTKWNAEEIDSAKFNSQNITVDQSMVELFKKVIIKCNSLNKQVILVNLPMQEEGQKLFSNYDIINQTATKIIRECNSKSNIRNFFLDYSKSDIASDKENYYNHGHLNAWGADKFSYVFSEDLISLGISKK